jgi:sugar (pentulose or hexulose) kinase
MSVVLAIDLGSTWCKAGLYDPQGRLVAFNRAPSRGGPQGPGASQADLDHWWDSVAEAVRPLAALARPESLAFSCRGYPGVYLDRQMVAIAAPGPARLSREATYATPGWGEGGPWARAYAPALAATGLWLRQAHPELHRQVWRLGALHDWLLWRLTGEWLTDPCDGPCGLLDWPPAAMAVAGLPREAFATLLPAETRAGELTPEAAERLGLPAGIPVACGSHDGAAANLGGNAWQVGDAMVTLGTNTVLRIVTGRPLEGWFGYPIPPGAYAWVRGIPGLAPRVEAARQQSPEAERTALEAVAAAVAELLGAARSCGLHPRQYQVTGGLTYVPYMRELLLQTLDGPVTWTDPEAGLRGAAMLAAVTGGWFDSVPAAAAAMRLRTKAEHGAK